MNRIGEVNDRASEEQAPGVNGAYFTMGSRAIVGVRGWTRRPGIKLVLLRN